MAKKYRKILLFGVPVSLRILVQRLSLFFLTLLTIAIIIIGKSDSDKASHLRAWMLDGLAPVIEVLSMPVNAVRMVGSGFSNLVLIYHDNERLRKQVTDSIFMQARLRELTAENTQLRALLKVIPDSKFFFITARVITDASGPYDRGAMITGGQHDGFKKGQVAVNEDGVVGRIQDVGENSTQLLLITDINSRIPVITVRSRLRGIMAGDNTAYPQLIHLPIGAELHSGEMLVTSGDGAFFPPGLPVGVVQVSGEGEKRTVRVVPFVHVDRLDQVMIVQFR